ncbi:MAG: ATP-binding protein [Acetobacteraceae bacterium]|nr:ATP-binding protein [Acetobacteraceae bacterium]
MGATIRTHDWTEASLGPLVGWPQALRTVLRIMLTSRYAMWLAWGPDLTFFCNDAYLPTLGRKQDWALGAPASKVWEEIWPDIGPRIERVLQTGEATWDEGLLLFLERSGYAEETYHTFSYSPAPDDAGGIGGMLCVVAEETERVIGERRMATLRDLAASLTSARDEADVSRAIKQGLGSALRDLPFTLTYLFEPGGGSARLVAATGLATGHPFAPIVLDLDASDALWQPPGDPTGSEIEDVALAPLAARLGVAVPVGAWDRPPRRAVLLPITAQGHEHPAGFLVAAENPFRPLDDAYGGFLRLVVGQVAAGLANAWAYEEERRRAEALAELDRAKTAFFSNVSHEFRTPLTLMLAPMEDALNDQAVPLPPSQRDRLELAHRNSLRLLRLVNTLLDFSRLEAGRVEASFLPTDLAALTADLVAGFRSAIERAGLALHTDLQPLPPDVYVDRDMWEKIVLNLLSNAFKFTFRGSIAVRLTVEHGDIVLRVKDTGVGVPADELPRLFERFHRIEGQRSRSFEGSGIGLALVNELVRLHGGSIAADSTPGVGTTFTVSLPLGTAHLPTAHLPTARVGTDGDAAPAAMRVEAFVEEALRWLPAGHAEPARDAVAPEPGEERAAGGTRPRVLVADDNADMRDYVHRLLASRYEVTTVPDGQAALAALRQTGQDLLLSDMMMPELDGFGLLAAIRADPALRELPVILLSARAGEEARAEGLDAGADDYLTKPFSARELVARVGANLAMARLRAEAATALRTRTAELETVLETVPVAVWFTYDPEARQVQGNRAAARLLRLPAGANALLSAPEGEQPEHFRMLNAAGQEVPADEQPLQRAARGEDVPSVELELRFDDASSVFLLAQARPIHGPSGVAGAICVATDVTARKQAEWALRALNEALEERVADRTRALSESNDRLLAEMAERERIEETLRHSQKMEAVGQLTGGLAHDFNNLLTGISGSLELLQVRVAQGRTNELDRYIVAARGATDRAASLTHRLLAFSRRQPLEPRPVQANRLIAGMEELIRRTIGPSITLEVVQGGGLWTTLCDPNQLENALLNLCINARDAMPDGGRLTIKTENAHLDARAAQVRDVAAGQYVGLHVTDTGVGMSPEVIARAFDPFFTTKPLGQGTGLGLSMAYGFVRQSGGQVQIDSEVGRGTSVKLYLPRHRDVAEVEEAPDALPLGPLYAQPNETVLVVDDEPTVRMLVAEVLNELGYIALEAADGAEGLRILLSDQRVDLLVTDVGLPGGMNGRQLADAARVGRPDLRVLFITGYAENAVFGNGMLEPGMQLIVKPFAMEVLASRIRAMISGR